MRLLWLLLLPTLAWGQVQPGLPSGSVQGNYGVSFAPGSPVPSGEITPTSTMGLAGNTQLATCSNVSAVATQSTIAVTLASCALNPGRLAPSWSVADIGKQIAITGLGAANISESTTITNVSAVVGGVQTLTLATTNGSTLSAATVLLAWGTCCGALDDAAAINAAQIQAQTSGGSLTLARRVYGIASTVSLSATGVEQLERNGTILVCLTSFGDAVIAPEPSGGVTAFTASYGSGDRGSGFVEGMGLCQNGLHAQAKGWKYSGFDIRDTTIGSIICDGNCTEDDFSYINVDNEQPGAPGTFSAANLPVTCVDNANVPTANSDNHYSHMNVTGCQLHQFWWETGSGVVHGADLHGYRLTSAPSTQTTTCTSTINAYDSQASPTFTGNLSSGATSGTLSVSMTSGLYQFTFSDGETRAVTVSGGTGAAWTGGLTNNVTASATSIILVSFTGSLSAGATSGTLTAAAPNGNGLYQFVLSNGQSITMTVSGGSSETVNWTTPVNASGATAQATLYQGSISFTLSACTGSPTFAVGNQIMVPGLGFNGNTATTVILSASASGGVETLNFGYPNVAMAPNGMGLTNATETLTWGTWPSFFRVDASAELSGLYTDDLSFDAANQIGWDITTGKVSLTDSFCHSPGTFAPIACGRLGTNLDHIVYKGNNNYGRYPDLAAVPPVPGLLDSATSRPPPTSMPVPVAISPQLVPTMARRSSRLVGELSFSMPAALAERWASSQLSPIQCRRSIRALRRPTRQHPFAGTQRRAALGLRPARISTAINT